MSAIVPPPALGLLGQVAFDHGFLRARDLTYQAPGTVTAKCKNVTRKANARCQVNHRSIKHQKLCKGSTGTAPFKCQDNHRAPWKLGETSAVMTVTDSTGAIDTGPFEVNVIDKTRPKITCPKNIATNTSQKKGVLLLLIIM